MSANEFHLLHTHHRNNESLYGQLPVSREWSSVHVSDDITFSTVACKWLYGMHMADSHTLVTYDEYSRKHTSTTSLTIVDDGHQDVIGCMTCGYMAACRAHISIGRHTSIMVFACQCLQSMRTRDMSDRSYHLAVVRGCRMAGVLDRGVAMYMRNADCRDGLCADVLWTSRRYLVYREVKTWALLRYKISDLKKDFLTSPLLLKYPQN